MSKNRVRLCDPGCARIFANSWMPACPPFPPQRVAIDAHDVRELTSGVQTFYSRGQMKKTYEGRGPLATCKNNIVYDLLFYDILHC